ncbi:hypothetical protein [Nostoc sp. 'Peltigera membranacea cyanobiont' N6]|uniref:hypothetical protein n=1 Tax=Nostoc sp. 'Peltigera membranacea cyanobiont' N6 TaxID=1261031 RepID=UPI000CF35220|nr:hypothetical protein [Nostoc sp. 'Peltigera membranacea cyanobiont' N6]AVH65599.1 hypothetical protein NPM_4043 [Nostoc sp. 'Peltigera membranacea cyanobiont' N6]
MKPNHLIYNPEREAYDLVLNGRIYQDSQINSVTFHGSQTLSQFYITSQYVVELFDDEGNEYKETLNRVVTDSGLIELLLDCWDEQNFAKGT